MNGPHCTPISILNRKEREQILYGHFVHLVNGYRFQIIVIIIVHRSIDGLRTHSLFFAMVFGYSFQGFSFVFSGPQRQWNPLVWHVCVCDKQANRQSSCQTLVYSLPFVYLAYFLGRSFQWLAFLDEWHWTEKRSQRARSHSFVQQGVTIACVSRVKSTKQWMVELVE